MRTPQELFRFPMGRYNVKYRIFMLYTVLYGQMLLYILRYVLQRT